MNFQVFGCPNCEQPFQVSDEQAGQIVQCPSCAQQVEIPGDAFGESNQPIEAPAEPHQVFACPNCSGQFGITPEMLGQQVGCPHCQSSILIQSPEPEPEPEPESIPPTIATDRPTVKTKKRKKPAPKSAPSKPEATKDLFAPGFKAKSIPAKSDLPDATKDTPSPAAPKTPTDRTQPGSQSTDANQATAKEKLRWRSPKKRTKKKKPEATDTPTPTPDADPTKAAPPKLEKPKPTRSPADPASEQPPVDRRVELYEHPDELPVDSANATRSDVVDSSVVEAVASPSPDAEPLAKEKEEPNAQLDARPDPQPQDHEHESPQPSVDDEAETKNDDMVAARVVPPEIQESEVDDDRAEPIDHLLPPRFDVLDPTQMAVKGSKNQFKVLLPDGKGGMAEFDERIVRVEHEGEQVSLVKMTAEQKARRRLIQNIIAIIVGIAMMGFAFWMLT